MKYMYACGNFFFFKEAGGLGPPRHPKHVQGEILEGVQGARPGEDPEF